MKLFTPRFLSLAASALLATTSMAQCLSGDNVAPGGNDPLVGQWAFHWESESQNLNQFIFPSLPAAAIGTFDVQRAAGTNFLTVNGNMTMNVNGRILRDGACRKPLRLLHTRFQCGIEDIAGEERSLHRVWRLASRHELLDVYSERLAKRRPRRRRKPE